MDIIILTPVRLLGDGLTLCLSQHPNLRVTAVIDDLSALPSALNQEPVDVVLVDVTRGIEFYDVRPVASQRTELALVAFGLSEQRQEVIRCGRAGFSGYISRDATQDDLCKSLCDIVSGRLACPAEISNGLLRALFCSERISDERAPDASLTPRESEVLQLIGGGFSNKEIARELSVSVATVKHHVHAVLTKLQLPCRGQAMRRVRDAPWVAAGGKSKF